jgi:hypothetical protein
LLIGPLPHPAVHFRGEDYLVSSLTTLREPSPYDLLGNSLAKFPSINVGGVKEVDSEIERAIHYRKRVSL